MKRKLCLLTILAVAISILAACAAPASTFPPPTTTAVEAAGRGADGELVLVYWQEISLLNPYLANGIKDYQAASLVLEPLVKTDPYGNLLPVLAAAVPTLDNGGVAPDMKSITYTLRPDVVWSDGTPLTADDVVFTWQYCTEPATGCGTLSTFAGVTRVEALDRQTSGKLKRFVPLSG